MIIFQTGTGSFLKLLTRTIQFPFWIIYNAVKVWTKSLNTGTRFTGEFEWKLTRPPNKMEGKKVNMANLFLSKVI